MAVGLKFTRANAGMITLLKTKRIIPIPCRPQFLRDECLNDYIQSKWVVAFGKAPETETRVRFPSTSIIRTLVVLYFISKCGLKSLHVQEESCHTKN